MSTERGILFKSLTASLLPLRKEVMGKNGVFKACLDSVPLLGKDALLGGWDAEGISEKSKTGQTDV